MEKKEQSKGDFVIIDAYNLIHRAYYGNMNKLTNKDGIPTNAMYTFAKMIQKIPKKFDDLKYIVCVFDGGEGSNFRKEIDPEYKAQRSETPEDLKIQIPYIKEIVNLLGFPILYPNNEEADDIIGTLAVRASKSNFSTYIFSGDKDFRALVNDNIVIIDTMKDIVYNRDKIKEVMDIYPEQVRDYLVLLGDAVDNVPGVEKVGAKTAAKLLNQYQDLEGIKNNLKNIKGVVGENLKKAFESGLIEKNKKLISLKLDCEVKITSKFLTKKDIEEKKWEDFCEKMDFKSFLKNPSPKI